MFEKLLDSKEITDFKNLINNEHSLIIEKLWDAPKAALASLIAKNTNKHVLIITGALQEENRLYDDFSFFYPDGNVVELPAWDVLPSENISPSPDITGERYSILNNISQAQSPFIILSNLQACLQRTILPKTLKNLTTYIKVGNEISFTKLHHKLIDMGYQRRSLVVEKGEFAIRGGIIDIFPVSDTNPARIEFFGDEIESIRIFDTVGQKSINQITNTTILPAQELKLLQDQDTLSSIIDHLGKNVVIIFDDIESIEHRYASLSNMEGTISKTFSSLDVFLDEIKSLQKLLLYPNTQEQSNTVFFNNNHITTWSHPFKSVLELISPEIKSFTHGTQELLLAINALKKYTLHFLCSKHF